MTVCVRYISSSSTLQALDVSGAVKLGNTGAVKFLQACRTCGVFGGERGEGRVCLKGCGMESPLPSELVGLLRSVLKGPQDCAVDLSGNKIDSNDKRMLFCLD